jgi:hypothetical protein
MNTLAFTLLRKPASSQPSAAATEVPAAATARTRLHKWRSALGTGTDARAQEQQIIGDPGSPSEVAGELPVDARNTVDIE